LFGEEPGRLPTPAPGEYVETVVEVLAKGAVRDGCCEITIGGGDDAHVDPDRLSSTDPLEFPFLQHSEQSDLGIRQQLAHFVQEDRSALGQWREAASSRESESSTLSKHKNQKLQRQIDDGGFQQMACNDSRLK
jgi:hypothetical protein